MKVRTLLGYRMLHASRVSSGQDDHPLLCIHDPSTASTLSWNPPLPAKALTKFPPHHRVLA